MNDDEEDLPHKQLTCAWCGEVFTRQSTRGPAPSYCSPAHRQRAYEARREEADEATLRASFSRLADEIDRLRAVLDKWGIHDELDPVLRDLRAEKQVDLWQGEPGDRHR